MSHLLRSKLNNKDIAHSTATTVNQGWYVSKSLWGFAKNVIEKALPYCLPSPMTIAHVSLLKRSLLSFLLRNLPFRYIQYDQYRNAKQVLKSTQHHHQHRITNELTSQGLVISLIFKYASKVTTSIWSNVQQELPRTIVNFFFKYLKNTLTIRKNLLK